jgi:hypothetical protein
MRVPLIDDKMVSSSRNAEWAPKKAYHMDHCSTEKLISIPLSRAKGIREETKP